MTGPRIPDCLLAALLLCIALLVLVALAGCADGPGAGSQAWPHHYGWSQPAVRMEDDKPSLRIA